MANFLKSLIFGESSESEEQKVKRNFDIFKYDGIKALRIGKIAYAIRCFNEALKLQEDQETLENLAQAYVQSDEYEKAIKVAGRLIEMQPENIHFLLYRANLYFTIEKYPEAIEDCQKAIWIESQNPVVYFLLAKAQKASGDALGAIVSLSQAIAWKEDYAEALLLRAELLLAGGDCKEGLKDAEKVVELLPEDENAYLIRGKLYEKLGDKQNAEDNYRYIIELNPFHEESYLQLGGLYMSEGQPDKALELFDEVLELRPDFSKAYTERGRARLMKGDKNGAFEDMKKAIELNPEGEEAKKIEGTYSNFEEMYANKVI